MFAEPLDLDSQTMLEQRSSKVVGQTHADKRYYNHVVQIRQGFFSQVGMRNNIWVLIADKQNIKRDL